MAFVPALATYRLPSGPKMEPLAVESPPLPSDTNRSRRYRVLLPSMAEASAIETPTDISERSSSASRKRWVRRDVRPRLVPAGDVRQRPRWGRRTYRDNAERRGLMVCSIAGLR